MNGEAWCVGKSVTHHLQAGTSLENVGLMRSARVRQRLRSTQPTVERLQILGARYF